MSNEVIYQVNTQAENTTIRIEARDALRLIVLKDGVELCNVCLDTEQSESLHFAVLEAYNIVEDRNS